MYSTPTQFYFRLHFERSRFNRTLEDKLLILANEIISLGMLEREQFNNLLEKILIKTSQTTLTAKAIRNQRTEMLKLFGLVKYINHIVVPGNRLTLLAQTQDIPRFFKSFCKQFQFPGGFLKPDKVSKMVTSGIKFKPAQYILKILKVGESRYKTFALNAAEVCHFIFNDKRVTVDKEKPDAVLKRIIAFRQTNVNINKDGDTIRYARDFLKYMIEANLLFEFQGMYVLNNKESKSINAIISDREFFDEFSKVINKDGTWDKNAYQIIENKWTEWFADALEDPNLETTTEALIQSDSNLPEEWKKIKDTLEKKDPKFRGTLLKEIGDEGEKIVYEYEKSLIPSNRKDILSMIRIVSSTQALGYDITSVNQNDYRRKKFIEVKTTKKNYNNETEIPFTISINEWSVAKQYKEDYCIYRVTITKSGISIFVIENPVQKADKNHITAEPIGFKIFYTKQSGNYLDLKSMYEKK